MIRIKTTLDDWGPKSATYVITLSYAEKWLTFAYLKGALHASYHAMDLRDAGINHLSAARDIRENLLAEQEKLLTDPSIR